MGTDYSYNKHVTAYKATFRTDDAGENMMIDGAKKTLRATLIRGSLVADVKLAGGTTAGFHAALTAEFGADRLKGSSVFQMGKWAKLFGMFGIDQDAASKVAIDAGKLPTWTNVYKLACEDTGSRGGGEGDEGEGDEGEGEGTAGTADKRRIVKVDLDDPAASLGKLDEADIVALAGVLAALLSKQVAA